MFSLVYTVYCQKLPTGYRCSVRKGVFKNFIKFIGKHLCWSLFLIKLQAWHLFWRTSSNDCFCTALAPLTVTTNLSVLLSPSSSSSLLLLLISPMFVFGSNSKGFKEFKSGISFSLKSLSSVSFFFHVFSVFLSFVLFFLVAAPKKDTFKLRID